MEARLFSFGLNTQSTSDSLLCPLRYYAAFASLNENEEIHSCYHLFNIDFIVLQVGRYKKSNKCVAPFVVVVILFPSLRAVAAPRTGRLVYTCRLSISAFDPRFVFHVRRLFIKRAPRVTPSPSSVQRSECVFSLSAVAMLSLSMLSSSSLFELPIDDYIESTHIYIL